jgi:hypothetical protein
MIALYLEVEKNTALETFFQLARNTVKQKKRVRYFCYGLI